MRVVFVLGTTTGGTGRHVRMLAAGCAAAEVPALVLGPGKTDRDLGFTDSPSVRFAPVEIAERPRVPHDLRALARLRRLLRAAAPDVVHAHGLRAGALTALALSGVLGVRRRPPLVVTVHNAPPGGGAPGAIYRVLELIVARRADSVLCVSADLEARMRAAGARRVGHAVVPVPDATAPDGDAAFSAPDGGGPIVLAVGRLASQKGFGILLEAVAFLRDLRPEPRLMIAGDGPLYDELKAKAASLGVAAEFTGHRSDIPGLLAAAAVFVLPSLWEGQALILQQALRAGVPIVATRTGGNPALTGHDASASADDAESGGAAVSGDDAVSGGAAVSGDDAVSGGAALLVPPADPARLAAAIRSVLTDPALADRLRKAALDRSRSLPGEATAISAALSEYRHVTGDRQGWGRGTRSAGTDPRREGR